MSEREQKDIIKFAYENGQLAERERIIKILNSFRWKLHSGIKEDLKPAFSALFLKMMGQIERVEG